MNLRKDHLHDSMRVNKFLVSLHVCHHSCKCSVIHFKYGFLWHDVCGLLEDVADLRSPLAKNTLAQPLMKDVVKCSYQNDLQSAANLLETEWGMCLWVCLRASLLHCLSTCVGCNLHNAVFHCFANAYFNPMHTLL